MTLSQTNPVAASTIATVAGVSFEGNFSLAGVKAQRITVTLYRHFAGHTGDAEVWTHSENVPPETAQTGDYAVPIPPRLQSGDFCWKVSVLDTAGATSNSAGDRPAFTLSSTAPSLSVPTPSNGSNRRTLNGMRFSARWSDPTGYRPVRGHVQMQASGGGWSPAELLWDEVFIVPSTASDTVSVQFGGRGVFPAGAYQWRIWAENEIGEASNTLTQTISQTVGFEVAPGSVIDQTTRQVRPGKWRIVIKDTAGVYESSVILPFGSTFNYKVDAYDHDTGFEAPGYDTSTWLSGAGGFGWNHPTSTLQLVQATRLLNESQINTAWVDPTPVDAEFPANNTDITIVKDITVPANAPALRFTYGIDDEVWFYIDGVQVGHYLNSGNSQRTDFSLIVEGIAPGTHKLAIRARNRNFYVYHGGDLPFAANPSFFEVQVEALSVVGATYGAAQDLNRAFGTVTSYSDWPGSTPANPERTNDGDDNSQSIGNASVVTDVGTWHRGWISDLGAAYAVSSMRVKTFSSGLPANSHGGELAYSTTGVNGPWIAPGYSLSGNGDDATYTFAAPVTARYWRIGEARTGTPLYFWSDAKVSTWEITGSPGWTAGISADAGRGPGNVVAIIENANSVGVSEYYNSGGELHFTLPTLHPYSAVINPYESHWSFQMYRGEGWKEVNAGLITDYDTTETDTIFYGADYIGMLGLLYDERFNPYSAPDAVAALWPNDAALHPDTQVSGSKYVGNTITEIITDQLNRAINSPNSPVGFIGLGSIAAMPETVTVFATLAQRLQFIFGLIDSHRAGTGKRTRLRVQHNQDDTYEFVVEDNPGSLRPDMRMEYGGLIQGYRAVPFGDFATRVLAIGRKTNGLELSYTIANTPIPNGETDPDYNVSRYGNLPKVNLWTDISDINDLRRRAAQYASQVGAIGKQVGLGIKTNMVALKDDWDICDSLPIVIKRGKLDTTTMGNGYWTVWGWSLNAEADTELRSTFSLLPYMPETTLDPALATSAPVDTTPAFVTSTTDPDNSTSAPSGAGTWVNTESGHVWVVDPETGWWTDSTASGDQPEFPRFRAIPPGMDGDDADVMFIPSAPIAAGTYELATEGGQSAIKAHGSMGSAETFDPTDGNVHSGTLNANCAFTLSAPDGSGAATLELWITQDGTGGWTSTWAATGGIIVWDGGAPSPNTASGVTVRYILETIDGGAIWIGNMVGGGGSPATTVESETAFGIAPAVGADVEYARQDHTHGSPQNPVTAVAIAALGFVGEMLLSDTPSTPLIFADLIQNEAQDDLIYADT